MATNIEIPNVGESVESGVIASWSVEDGAYVERDDTVLELETDKVTMDVPAPASGTVKHGASAGDEVEVGSVVGEIDESAEKPGSGEKSTEQKGSGEKKQAEGGEDSDDSDSSGATATATKEAPEKSSSGKDEKSQSGSGGQKKAAGSGDKDQVDKDKADASMSSPEPSNNGAATGAGSDKAGDQDSGAQVKATPLARKLASDRGVDLSRISGTGTGGRVREQDVLAFIQSSHNGQSSGSDAAPEAQPAPAQGGSRETTLERMSPMRRRIASRLVEAQQTAAMLTTFNEVDMGAVMDLRKKYKEPFAERHGIGLGFMSFFVKASVRALQKFPMVNSYIAADDDGKAAIQGHAYQDIAIAVSGPKGLVVPVIRNAETMSFAKIEESIKDFGTRAKDGKLDLSEMTGGTFTITNGGVFGSLLSTPILNPPQSAILGMHGIKNRPAEDPQKPGEIAMRPMMYLALSYDHRIVDGSDAVRFLVSIKESIEDPSRLMLDL